MQQTNFDTDDEDDDPAMVECRPWWAVLAVWWVFQFETDMCIALLNRKGSTRETLAWIWAGCYGTTRTTARNTEELEEPRSQ